MQGSIGCMVVVTVRFQWLQAFICCRVTSRMVPVGEEFQQLQGCSGCVQGFTGYRVPLAAGFSCIQGSTDSRGLYWKQRSTGCRVPVDAWFQWL